MVVCSMGVGFHPTDEELINYLKKFVTGQPLPEHDFIKIGEVYNYQPWELFGDWTGKVRYFFSPLKKLKKSHKRFVRTIGNGTWKGQTKGQDIEDATGRCVVGYMRSLKYHSTTEKQHNDKWIMKEYYLGDDFLKRNHIVKEDFVLCRIKNKKKEEARTKEVREITEEDVEEVIEDMLGVEEVVEEEEEVIMEDGDHEDDDINSVMSGVDRELPEDDDGKSAEFLDNTLAENINITVDGCDENKDESSLQDTTDDQGLFDMDGVSVDECGNIYFSEQQVEKLLLALSNGASSSSSS